MVQFRFLNVYATSYSWLSYSHSIGIYDRTKTEPIQPSFAVLIHCHKTRITSKIVNKLDF